MPTRRPTSTRRHATGGRTCASSAPWSRASTSAATRSSSCRRSSTSSDPAELLAHFSELAPVSYVSTPNRLTLAPEGAEKSENPWHLREYTAAEYRELVAPQFESVEIYGLFHAGKLRLHELALKAGWDRVHPALGLTKRFYDRFVPAISVADFALRREGECDLDSALDFIAVCRS